MGVQLQSSQRKIVKADGESELGAGKRTLVVSISEMHDGFRSIMSMDVKVLSDKDLDCSTL